MTEKPIHYYALILSIHTAISRGLQVIIKNAEIFLQSGFPDERTKTGFYRYVYSLALVMQAHFRLTEEVVYPYFQEKLPTLRLNLIIEQHQQMLPHVEIIETVNEKINADGPSEAFTQLIETCNKLNILWKMHTQTEENFFKSDSVMMRQLTQEEQSEVSRKAAEFTQKFYIPNTWVAPFILYNLPFDLRETISKQIPSNVTEQLVPITWRDEWEPMKPFLLDA